MSPLLTYGALPNHQSVAASPSPLPPPLHYPHEKLQRRGTEAATSRDLALVKCKLPRYFWHLTGVAEACQSPLSTAPLPPESENVRVGGRATCGGSQSGKENIQLISHILRIVYYGWRGSAGVLTLRSVSVGGSALGCASGNVAMCVSV